MLVYQKKAKDRIRKELPKMRRLVERSLEGNYSEADTRLVVAKIIDDMLGWCKFEHLTGEQSIRGGYADFILQKDGNQLAVIEVKAVNIKLNERHLRQACNYAFGEGIEFVILTNGNSWRIYHITFVRNGPPQVCEVFRVRLTDKDMKPSDKVELLYYLSEEAYRKRELREYCSRNIALSGQSLAKHILDKQVLDKIRLGVRRVSGHAVTNEEVALALISDLLCEDALPNNLDAIMKRVRSGK